MTNTIMIPLNTYSSQIDKSRKQIGGFQGPHGESTEQVLLVGLEFQSGMI